MGVIMILTVFRLRLSTDPAVLAEYSKTAPRMAEIAKATPGFISIKRFDADDGERVTIVEFADLASHELFVSNPEHRAAQSLGKAKAFTEYDIKVCEVFKTMKK